MKSPFVERPSDVSLFCSTDSTRNTNDFCRHPNQKNLESTERKFPGAILYVPWITFAIGQMDTNVFLLQLLEVAMATTFAGLTCVCFHRFLSVSSDLLLFLPFRDGTPVLRPSVSTDKPKRVISMFMRRYQNVVSYTSFFALVWWIWASQVAYNVRFRQPDWLHRFFVFLQLLVFAALSAFTNKFDITDGIRLDRDQERILELQSANQMSTADLNAEAYRNQRMPTLNARGISMVVALSRLLLFVQYCLGAL